MKNVTIKIWEELPSKIYEVKLYETDIPVTHKVDIVEYGKDYKLKIISGNCHYKKGELKIYFVVYCDSDYQKSLTPRWECNTTLSDLIEDPYVQFMHIDLDYEMDCLIEIPKLIIDKFEEIYKRIEEKGVSVL